MSADALLVMVAINPRESNIDFGMISQEMHRYREGRRRCKYLAAFTEKERKAIGKYYSKAQIWTLAKGLPDRILMSTQTYALLVRLCVFIAEN